MLARSLGCCVAANVSCRSLVWSRSRYNAMGNVVGGMYNKVFVVNLIVYI